MLWEEIELERFFADVKKYREYAVYSAKSYLKAAMGDTLCCPVAKNGPKKKSSLALFTTDFSMTLGDSPMFMFLYFVIPCTIDAPVRVPHISPVPATPVPNPDVILEAISSFNPVTSVNTRATHWEQL